MHNFYWPHSAGWLRCSGRSESWGYPILIVSLLIFNLNIKFGLSMRNTSFISGLVPVALLLLASPVLIKDVVIANLVNAVFHQVHAEHADSF